MDTSVHPRFAFAARQEGRRAILQLKHHPEQRWSCYVLGALAAAEGEEDGAAGADRLAQVLEQDQDSQASADLAVEVANVDVVASCLPEEETWVDVDQEEERNQQASVEEGHRKTCWVARILAEEEHHQACPSINEYRNRKKKMIQ